MVMLKVTTVLLFLLCCCSQSNAPQAGFPQLIWTFWDGDLSNPNTQIFLKLCLNNMRQYATKSGWQFSLVTYDNLPQYLTPQSYEEILQFLQKINTNLKQKRSDVIRLYLLKDNGGMWIDSTSFFTQQLHWINNIAQEKIPIVNKISLKPDLITFQLNGYERPNPWIQDAQLGQRINISPGFQSWAIISKKNTSFIRDSLKVIKQMVFEDQTVLKNKIIENHVEISQHVQISYFEFGVYTFQLALQFKQRQLDILHQDKGNNSVSIGPKYAVQFYNIWTISCEDMGYNLDHASDGVIAFLAINYLTFPAERIDQLKMELKGFIKLGGPKRMYVEAILELILNPTMCWIVLVDANKLTNQSYLYKKLIQDNKEPIGLALREKIMQIKPYQDERLKVCADSPKLSFLSMRIKHLTFYVCLYIALLVFLSILWVKCNGLTRSPKKVIFSSLLCILGVYLIAFTPTASLDETCQEVELRTDSYESLKAKGYFNEIRNQLPADNGTILQLFYNEFALRLTDDFSLFVSAHRFTFVSFFWKQILGAIILFALLLATKLKQPVIVGERKRKMLKKARLGLLLLILVVSLLMLLTSFSLKQSVKRSICFLSLGSDVQLGTVEPSNITLVEQNKMNFVMLVDILHERFENMTEIFFKGSFKKQLPEYLGKLQSTQQALISNKQNKQLANLLSKKLTLLIKFRQSFRQTDQLLLCESRIIESAKMVLDNLKKVTGILQFFLNNFQTIQIISFLASGILIALSLIFCLFSLLLLFRSFETYKTGSRDRKQQTMTFAMLSFLGIASSFLIKVVILPNYYLCDFFQHTKDSIQNSSDFFDHLMPRKCMADTLTDLLKKSIEQNYKLRNKHFQTFANESEKVYQIVNYPYDKEGQLLSRSPINNSKSDFFQLNDKYNQKLHLFSQLYYQKQKATQQDLDKTYSFSQNRQIETAETLFYQPLCVFNFNVLYELQSYFAYMGLLNLLAFIISLLLGCQKMPYGSIPSLQEKYPGSQLQTIRSQNDS